MTEQIFSEREGLVPQKDLQAYDYLPGWTRTSITNELRDLSAKMPAVYSILMPYIWKTLDKQPSNSPIGGPFTYYIPAFMAQCHWYHCYDALEELSRRLEVEEKEEFYERISAILAREGIPWKLEQGKVIRALNAQIAQQINEARVLLADPRFKGPDEQFAKAIEHLNRRPDPDEENSVKDAVGALEAVANIIAGTNGRQLNYLIRDEPFKSGIHPTIIQAVDKLYAYRGAAPGAGHGQVGPAVVKIEDAEWVLATSAATIILFAAKF